MTKIFIATTSFGEHDRAPLDMLREHGCDAVRNPFQRTLGQSEIVGLAGGCAGIIAGTERYSREVLAALPDLKIISRCGIGLDTIDLDAAAGLGVAVTAAPDGTTQGVAELTLGLILSLIRQVESASAALKRGVWKKRMGFLLGELTVGIIGLGRIGKRLAALLRTFDAAIVGHDIEPDRAWASAAGVRLVDRDSILRESDVICLHLPYEPRLRHLVGAREIAMMKPTGYLVNAARGGLVDEEALYAALKSGRLAGAALDTFEQEPYNGPLRELENAILTPHIGSYARAGRIRMERESVRNVLAGLVR